MLSNLQLKALSETERLCTKLNRLYLTGLEISNSQTNLILKSRQYQIRLQHNQKYPRTSSGTYKENKLGKPDYLEV